MLNNIFERLPQTLILLLASSTLAVASTGLADFERRTNESLLWGPYRPNVYFGVRPRIPDGPLMGLMWARVDDYESIQARMLTIGGCHTSKADLDRLSVHLRAKRSHRWLWLGQI